MARTECYGSSGSMEGIKEVIRSFYCMVRNDEVTLVWEPGGSWAVTTHKPLPNVVVWYAKGRFRFGKRQ